MARPDLDDGWFKLAHELDAALACADFSKGARVVLREVFAQVFGPAKLPLATLSPSEIGRRWGKTKGTVQKAIAELVASGVLVKVDGTSYRFAKDYELWVWHAGKHRGQRRLSDREVISCRHAPRVALSFKHATPDQGAPSAAPSHGSDQQNSVLQLEYETYSNRSTLGTPTGVPNVLQLEYETYSNGSTKSSPPCTPLLGRRIKDPQDIIGDDDGAEGLSSPDSADPKPAPDPAEVARLAARLEAMAPLEEVGSKVAGFAKAYPLAWIEEAVLLGLSAARPGKVWAYAHRCLLGWHVHGKPAPAAPGGPGPAANEPRSIRRMRELKESIRNFDFTQLAPQEGTSDAR